MNDKEILFKKTWLQSRLRILKINQRRIYKISALEKLMSMPVLKLKNNSWEL
jgi:hypothetical protein